MQLLSIALYNVAGDIREIPFRTGQLNIVTGESKTGKSTLLSIVDYCLGNDDVSIPRSRPMQAVEWFGTLWQFEDGSRVFVARRRRHQSKSNAAMIKFGSDALGLPRLSDLVPNATSESVRTHVGNRIGLAEAKLQPSEYSDRAFKVSLGSAAFLCFQEQSEIANKYFLFHRQGEPGVKDHIKDTLPYFLGAVGGDQAAKRQAMRDARKQLRRVELELERATQDASEIDTSLRALLLEAHTAGLIDVGSAPDVATTVRLLSIARDRSGVELTPNADVASQDARYALEQERDELRRRLHGILSERELVLEQRAGLDGFGKAIGVQTSRLISLELLDLDDASKHASDSHCPVCRSKLREADPSASQLNDRLMDLRRELGDLTATNPLTAEALQALTDNATAARERLSVIESALRALVVDPDETSGAESRDFIRGRIDATLERHTALDDRAIAKLRSDKEVLEIRIAGLEDELNAESVAESLGAKLYSLHQDMTAWAQEMELEHSEFGVRLDLNRLTVVADTSPVPTPLREIGSAANWVGYHLVAHLALHRLFTRSNRPVPRLLMIDQPTQAFYTRGGDKKAVKSIFKISKRVADELAPAMQIIIIDHANLKAKWFQKSVVHDWETEALVPRDWYEDDDTEDDLEETEG